VGGLRKMNIPVYETKPFEQNDKKMWRGGYYDGMIS
jgi:hypothetical protein